jgi:DNA-directed RNA polymerase I, II, and III subunit RPABC2
MSDNEDNDDSYSNNSDNEDNDDDEDTPYVNPINAAKSIKDTTNTVVGDGDEDDEDDGDADEEYDDEDDVEDDVEDDIEADVDSKVGGKTPNLIVNNDAAAAANYDSDDDDDDTYDDNYLQKFDSEITKNYINEYHPECLHHNYDEIALMSLVTRDNHNIIIDAFHKTIPTLTKYEKARILGQRASQIESGAKPLVSVPEHIVEGYLIAELELKQKRIPFIIRRPIPGGGCEYWNIKDLEDISF